MGRNDLDGEVLWTGLDLGDEWDNERWERKAREYEAKHQARATQFYGWREMVSKLRIEDGDLILLKYQQGSPPDGADIELVREAIRRTGAKATALFIPADWGLHRIPRDLAAKVLSEVSRGVPPKMGTGYNAKPRGSKKP